MLGRTYAFITVTKVRSYSRNSGSNSEDKDTGSAASISCTNANLDFEFGTGQDSISEVWMEVPGGAVASYGATRTTNTTPNHHLNEKLFKVEQ